MIAIVCQYHHADAEQAAELCRFIADIEPQRREDVRIRLVARRDTPHLAPETINHLARKFDVSWAHSMSLKEGWPNGPNSMACEILCGAKKWLHEAGWDDAIGVLMLEPDCVPLQRDWLNQLIRAWDFAMLDGAWCMGSWRNSGGAYGHINGAAMYRTDFGQKAHLDKCPDHLAWDCYAAAYAHKHWCISGLFRNDFQSRNATEKILRTPETGGVPPVLSHGFKDQSALRIARKWCTQEVAV